MLTADDDVPGNPRRILVAGVSGVGKSTFAARLSSAVDIRHTELDALFHGPQWTPRPEFLDDVGALAGRESWITEWQYTSARPLLVDRAELLVWLDLPFRVTWTRVLRRTLRRRFTREQLWNGNVEPPLHTFFTSKEHILRWAIATRNMYGDLIAPLATTRPDLVVVRLRSSADVDSWLARRSSDRRI